MEEVCPECREKGIDVEALTVRHMLEPFVNYEVEDTEYRICIDRDCSVVYFDGESVFREEDVRVAVNFKMEPDERPFPLCYCYGYGKEDLESELTKRGETGVPDWIAQRVRNGECACTYKNPKGRCCLGDVNAAVEELKEELLGEDRGASGGEHCC